MWTYDDAPSSGVGVPDMDMRACPSYEAGFDACDPLGSVFEWSGRGPARVLRRRCRSEGVDRSPYEEMPMHRSADNTTRTHRLLPNKSQFTLNTAIQAHFGRPGHEISARVAENGDYIMTHEHSRHGYPQVRSKLKKTSPTRINNILSHAAHPKMEEDRHLPKVEELLEKYDHDMMEVPVTKQPLKSILNNPLLKSPPQGILKKPKTKAYQDPKSVQEGRRRQRASSESDNLFCGFNGSNSVYSYESRFSQNMNNLNNMKRAKDNSGTGYSYGTAIATLSSSVPKANVYMPKVIRSHAYKDLVAHKDEVPQIPPVPHDVLHMSHQPVIQVLRTTAIHNERHVVPAVEVPRQEPVSLCPKGSPELQVSSTALQLPAAKKPPKPIKKKVKVKPKVQMKTKVEPSAEVERPVSPRRPPEPLALDPWKMDTDVLLNEIQKLERIVDKRRNSAKSPTSPKSPGTKKDKDKEKDKDKKKEKDKEADKEKEKDDQNDTSINKLSNKLNGAVVSNKQTKESVLNLPDHIVNCLRLSLFPRVPPYLKFVAHDENPTLKVPMAIQKHLKWKLTTITPIVVKRTITNSGFRLVKSECDTAECPQEETVEWIGIWGKHMKSLMFRAIKDGQKMNHFPGTFQIGRKDRLWRNLQKLASKFGLKEFGIMPKSYVLPHDLKLLKRDWERYSENNEKWIIKPPASARGTGIKVVSRWTQIPKKRPVVVQRYICKPYLINGSKFDMRLYVLVTSVHPLRIYLYKDGLARFASVKYTNEITSLNDRYMHLTNYSINRLSKNYTPNEDFSACEGHKWTLQTLFQYLKTEKNVDTRTLWESLKDLVIKTIISGEASISSLTKANVTSRYNCYELFGVDVLLDEDLKPWLLEVNISPSLHSASPLDIHVKGPLVTTVLNIAQFQVPIKTNLDILAREKPHKLGGLPYDSRLYTVYLSKEERDKHIIYTNMEERDIYLRDILSTLTPDDVRHLIQAEDEYTQIGDMERIFPTKETHKYLGYLTGPRYYNRLFDAWETRYAMNREPGIDLLRNLCDIGYHLEVPPVPLKNDVDAPSPPLTERPSNSSLTSVEPSTSTGSAHVSRAGSAGAQVAAS